jgi:glutaminase
MLPSFFLSDFPSLFAGDVPNRLGIGIIGPAIDDKGNSVAGIRMLEQLSREYQLHSLSQET